MSDAVRPLFDGLHTAAEHLRRASDDLKVAAETMVAAVNHIGAANAAFGTVIDAAMHAQNEHEDLRRTVNRLELMVMAQSVEIRTMREQMEKQQGNGS